MVSVAVAVSFWDVRTSTIVDGTRTVADAASIELADAVVYVVTDAVGIGVSGTVATTHAQGVELVSFAVAVPFWDVRTSAFVDRARSVADAASIELSDAVVHVVTDAVGIGVSGAVATTHAQGVELVSITVAVSFWDVRTSTIVDVTRTVANTASIELSDAVVHVVADAVGIGVSGAVAAAITNDVELVSITVAVTFWDAFTVTHATLVKDIAVTVAVALRNV